MSRIALQLLFRRTLLAIPILLCVSALVFCILRLLPADPIAMSLPPGATAADFEKLNPGGVAGAFYTAFGVAGLTEEIAKALVLYFVVWRHPAFDERVDGIVYATRAGLGFALVENVGYLFGAQSLSGMFGLFVVRAVLAVPGHAIYAGFMGYWAARKKFDGVGPGLLGGLGVAVFLHGAYDCALFLIGVIPKDGATVLLIFPLLAVPIIVVVGGYRRLKQHAEEAMRLDELTHAPRPALRLPFGVGFVLR